MDVVDHGAQRFGAREVPVIAPARPPEAPPQTLPFAHRHSCQPLRRVILQIADRFAGTPFGVPQGVPPAAAVEVEPDWSVRPPSSS